MIPTPNTVAVLRCCLFPPSRFPNTHIFLHPPNQTHFTNRTLWLWISPIFSSASSSFFSRFLFSSSTPPTRYAKSYSNPFLYYFHFSLLPSKVQFHTLFQFLQLTFSLLFSIIYTINPKIRATFQVTRGLRNSFFAFQFGAQER